MTPEVFKKTYLDSAQKAESVTKVPFLVTLGQAALESGWGNHAPGYNFFGIKGKPGQLLRTTEFHDNPKVPYPVILNILKISDHQYKYTIKDYFRVYQSPEDSFIEHGNFIRKNARYSSAFTTSDPYMFADKIAKEGYATDPDYSDKLKSVIKSIERLS